MAKKICFVVQRYGLEVNGGAELHCRQLAEHLHERYEDIHVLTTKAIDYMTWKNEYTADEEIINGIKVHRFPVAHERNQDAFNAINGKFMANKLLPFEEKKWIEAQGPAVPGLIKYLQKHKDDYDVFIFCTYLYYPTVMGVPVVKDKAIVVPDAHDEPFLRMHIFDDVFQKPRALFFNTSEEHDLVEYKYDITRIPYEIGGAGVDVPNEINAQRFRDKYHLQDEYIIYVGRIDEGKNCGQLFEYFIRYKSLNPGNLKLVLMGKPVIPIPEDENIISLGFVSDEDKFDGIQGASALILPSEFESLSIVVLEAMTLGTPVMVYGKSPVLRGHCEKSNGALYYNNYAEFEWQINFLLNHEDVIEQMVDNASQYIYHNYHWDRIINKLDHLIRSI